MRFVNTTSLKFHTVADSELRDLKNGYSILSHRWMSAEDEITYTDMLSVNEDVKAKPGYLKLTEACSLAKGSGFDLLWIDTCCINKADSVELGEAINSMYRWYSTATMCIAYLQDVTGLKELERSEWFRRGWTLQELIAPKTVHFHDRNWNYLGHKASLSEMLVRKTGIPSEVLENLVPPQACSIAQRMSWAAHRITARLEDQAYSLLGLFDVNMPMIYGEQGGAFMRLQEHIISKSADESIFAWEFPHDSSGVTKAFGRGLIAPSAACFANSRDVVSVGRSQGFRIDQFGLTISLRAMLHSLDTYYACLNATTKAGGNARCTLLLGKTRDDSSYTRLSDLSGQSMFMTSTLGDLVEFTVPLVPAIAPSDLYHGFWLRKLAFHDSTIPEYDILRRRCSPEHDRLILPEGALGTAGILRLKMKSVHGFASLGWIKLGFSSTCKPFCTFTWSPKGDADSRTNSMPADAEHLLALGEQSNERRAHPVFAPKWGVIDSVRFQDSRKSQSKVDDRVEFRIKPPTYGVPSISVSIVKVADIRPSISRQGQVWAVDIAAEDELPLDALTSLPEISSKKPFFCC